MPLENDETQTVAQTDSDRPKLGVKRVQLPDPFGDFWIDVKTSVKWGVLRRAAGANSKDPNVVTEMISSFIVGWNVKDEDGQELPNPHGNVEGFDEVSMDLFPVIMQTVTDVLGELMDGASGAGGAKN